MLVFFSVRSWRGCDHLLLLIQLKGSIAAEEQASKASARGFELEKHVRVYGTSWTWVHQSRLCGFWSCLFQIEKLKKDIAAQNSKKATMEARASDAEKKVQELNAKLERVSVQPAIIVLFSVNSQLLFIYVGINSWKRLHLPNTLKYFCESVTLLLIKWSTLLFQQFWHDVYLMLKKEINAS